MSAPQTGRGCDSPTCHSPQQVYLRLFVSPVVLAASTLAAASLACRSDTDWLGIATFAALTLGAELSGFELYGRTSFSVNFVPILAAGLLYGPLGCVVTAWTAGISRGIIRRSRWHKVLFNSSVFNIFGVLAVTPLVLFRPSFAPENFLLLLPSVILASCIYYLHTFAVATAIGLELRTHVQEVWHTNFRWLFPYYVVLGMLALLLALAYRALGIYGALAFVAPPFMLRYGMKQYVERTVEHVNTLKRLNEQLTQTAAALEQRTRQLTLLNELGQLHAIAVDVSTLLQEVAQRCMRAFGGGCVLLLVPREGTGLAALRVAHRDPASAQALRETLEAYAAAESGTALRRACEELVPTLSGGVSGRQTIPLLGNSWAALLAGGYLATPVKGQSRVLGAMLAMGDPSDHVLDEHDLALAQEIAERIALVIENAELLIEAVKVEALQEVNQLKTEFLSIASHELRSPLTSIAGFAELIIHTQPDPARQQEYAQIIYSEALRLSDLIDNLLDISRIEMGCMQLHLERLSLSKVLHELLRTRQIPRSHAIQVKVPADLPEVMADPGKLRQILENLVSNAIKYSPAGGIVTVEAEVCTDDPHMLEIRVRDQGIGIPPEHLPHLFSRFYRVQSTQTREIRGTGLGLYITRHLVELQGGRIWAESEPGKGSTFAFTVPVARPCRHGVISEASEATAGQAHQVTG